MLNYIMPPWLYSFLLLFFLCFYLFLSFFPSIFLFFSLLVPVRTYKTEFVPTSAACKIAYFIGPWQRQRHSLDVVKGLPSSANLQPTKGTIPYSPHREKKSEYYPILSVWLSAIRDNMTSIATSTIATSKIEPLSFLIDNLAPVLMRLITAATSNLKMFRAV